MLNVLTPMLSIGIPKFGAYLCLEYWQNDFDKSMQVALRYNGEYEPILVEHYQGEEVRTVWGNKTLDGDVRRFLQDADSSQVPLGHYAREEQSADCGLIVSVFVAQGESTTEDAELKETESGRGKARGDSAVIPSEMGTSPNKDHAARSSCSSLPASPEVHPDDGSEGFPRGVPEKPLVASFGAATNRIATLRSSTLEEEWCLPTFPSTRFAGLPCPLVATVSRVSVCGWVGSHVECALTS